MDKNVGRAEEVRLKYAPTELLTWYSTGLLQVLDEPRRLPELDEPRRLPLLYSPLSLSGAYPSCCARLQV